MGLNRLSSHSRASTSGRLPGAPLFQDQDRPGGRFHRPDAWSAADAGPGVPDLGRTPDTKTGNSGFERGDGRAGSENRIYRYPERGRSDRGKSRDHRCGPGMAFPPRPAGIDGIAPWSSYLLTGQANYLFSII